MECTNSKPVRPNSNMSSMVCKFAKVCKLKSIGVFSSEAPNFHHLHRPICGDSTLSESFTEENRFYDHNKVHPHPIEVSTKEYSCAGYEVLKKIFDALSAIKLAYLQLQQAHIPYDPKKIVAADDKVVVELEKLCKFKREYKAKQLKKARLDAASRSDPLLAQIVAKRALLEKLKSRNGGKDSEILRLWKQLKDLEIGNKNLAEKIKQISLEKRKASVLSVSKFQEVFEAASKSIHDFAKPLIGLMKVSGWDLDRAANTIENGAVYSKRCDKKYAFEAYIARRMFHGNVLTCDVSDIMSYDDPFDALMENPHSDFAKFCQAKYLLVVHPKMEESFFGNLDHRTFVTSGKHPRTEFYQLFAKMAKLIWVLLGSVVSLDPDAVMFSVSRGSVFSCQYMESVEEEKERVIISDEEKATYKVQFMIMPGFKIGQMVVKSKVYISKHS